MLIDLKRKYNDPYLVVTSDFNQWKAENYLDSFADISEAPVGNTRGNKAIDRTFTNMGRSIVEAGTVLPLETLGEEEELKRNDHRLSFCRFRLKKKISYRWETFICRRLNNDSISKFREWIVFHDWASVKDAGTSDAKA